MAKKIKKRNLFKLHKDRDPAEREAGLNAARERLDRRLPFGKHKGEDIQDVPDGYVQWLADNCNAADVRELAKTELARRSEKPARSSKSKKRKAEPKSDTPVGALEDTGIRTTTGGSIKEVEITDHTVNTASFGLLDRYLKVRNAWQDPPGFYAWLAMLGAYVLECGNAVNDYCWEHEDHPYYFVMVHRNNSRVPHPVFVGITSKDEPEPDWLPDVIDILESMYADRSPPKQARRLDDYDDDDDLSGIGVLDPDGVDFDPD